MTIEEDLRAAFARHEDATPAAGPLRDKIKAAVVRRKRRRAVVGAAVAVLAVGTALPVAMGAAHREITPPPVAGVRTAPPQIPTNGLNMLLIVNEPRYGSTARPDMLTIVHVAADLRHVYVVSLPRNGEVDGGRTLSQTFRDGGKPATRRAIAGLTGLNFDVMVTVDPPALSAVTDALGGVDVCLDKAVDKRHPAGCQQLDGADVLQILAGRYALPRGSYDRERNFQRCLLAMAGKLASDGNRANPKALRELYFVADRKGLTIDGDLSYLLQVASSSRAAEVVGIGAPSFSPSTDGLHERIYPQAGSSLYEALRRDDLAAWTAAHPTYVVKG